MIDTMIDTLCAPLTILEVIALLCVLYVCQLCVKVHQEAENFSRYWLQECRKTEALRETTEALRESFKSVMTMVLEQANEVKDAVSARECKEMLYSLRYESAPRQMLTRLPVIPHEINLNPPEKSARTKYFKGILSDGNPV
jgi:hypothetical protein